MRKYILIIFIFSFLFASKVWCNTFNEFYPEKNSVIININLAEGKDYLNWAKDSMMDKTYNKVLTYLNEKLSVDISKDIKDISISFIKIKIGFLSLENAVPFLYVTGNFKAQESWLTLINALTKETTQKETKVDKITIDGKEITFVNAGNLQYFFLNDSTLFIGVNGTNNLLEKKQITFTKAPESLMNISRLSSNYIYIKKDFIYRIPLISQLFWKSEKYESLSLFMKDNIINFVINIEDANQVENEAKTIKENIEKYQKQYEENFAQQKKFIKFASLNYFSWIAKDMYSKALFKKLIDNLKVFTQEHCIVVTLPFDDYLKQHAILSFINNILNGLYLDLNKDTLKTCKANIEQLTNAVIAYNGNDNSDLNSKIKDDEEKEDDYYSYRRTRPIIKEPNQTGRTTMILDIPTLYERGCLPIYPLKPEPDCEYLLYSGLYRDENRVVCLKHSFINNSNNSFGFGSDSRFHYNPGFGTYDFTKKAAINARSCYIIQKDLYKAIEKYNKSHNNKITKLDIPTLIERGIIDKEPTKPEKDCEYYSEGDLSKEEGFIGCQLHGLESYSLKHIPVRLKNNRINNIYRRYKLNKDEDGDYETTNKDRERKCFSNLRVINGAIEMYNMDHKVPMTSNLDFQTLVKEYYLKKIPDKPTQECEYYIEGDITKGGHVACKKHGHI